MTYDIKELAEMDVSELKEILSNENVKKEIEVSKNAIKEARETIREAKKNKASRKEKALIRRLIAVKEENAPVSATEEKKEKK